MMADRTKEKFSKIRELKCFDSANEMILAGFPISAVADFIQRDSREYVDVKRTSLIQMLSRYRETLKEDDLVSRTLPRVFVEARDKFSNKLEDLQRLDALYNMSEYRVRVAHGAERLTGNVNPQVDRMTREQREIIRQMHTIRMELGLSGSRDLGTITVSAEKLEMIKEKYGDGAARAFANPVSRNRVLAAFSAINRAGGIRDADGNRLSVTELAAMGEEEKQIIDAEFHVEEKGSVQEEPVPAEEEEEKKEMRRDNVKIPQAARAGRSEPESVKIEIEPQEKLAQDTKSKEEDLEKYLAQQRKHSEQKLPPGPRKPTIKRGK